MGTPQITCPSAYFLLLFIKCNFNYTLFLLNTNSVNLPKQNGCLYT